MSNAFGNRVATVPIPTVAHDAWKPEKTRARRRSIIREFALNTSTHALPGIARSQSKHNRIFWTISFLIFTGVMIYFITQSIIKYFQYPSQTSISIVVELPQLFPAVTICNYSPARSDTFMPGYLEYLEKRNITNIRDDNKTSIERTFYLRDFLISIVNDQDIQVKYFFSLKNMLIGCMYNTQPCGEGDFIMFASSVHGLCYTFNARTKNDSGENLRRTNQNGGTGRLTLSLYAHSHLYVPYAAEGRLYSSNHRYPHLSYVIQQMYRQVWLPWFMTILKCL
jgi:hypothetical protein